MTKRRYDFCPFCKAETLQRFKTKCRKDSKGKYWAEATVKCQMCNKYIVGRRKADTQRTKFISFNRNE